MLKSLKSYVCVSLKRPLNYPPLRIDEQVLETVRSHKVPGLVIKDNLKWKEENTCMIVSKASKRLHIIRVLRRGGASATDLLVTYVALVRSVLEYCCVVWHNALPVYLSSESRVRRNC